MQNSFQHPRENRYHRHRLIIVYINEFESETPALEHISSRSHLLAESGGGDKAPDPQQWRRACIQTIIHMHSFYKNKYISGAAQ